MDKKIMIVIIVLIVITVFSLFAAFQFYNSHRILQKDYQQAKDSNEKLDRQNKELTGRFSSLQEEKTRLQERMDAIQKDLDLISRERNDLKSKYDVLLKEKDTLIAKLEKMSKEPAVQAAQPPQTDDAHWAGILKEKAALELQVKNMQQGIKDLQIRLDEADKDRSNLELQVSKLTQDSKDLERQMEYNQKLADGLSKDLVREKEDKQSLLAQMRTLKEENALLRRDIKETKQIKIALEKRLQGIDEEKSALKDRIETMDKDIRESVLDIEQIRKQVQDVRKKTLPAEEPEEEKSSAVELPPIIVRPQEEVKVAPTQPLEGTIVALNKENNFVIIDLGQNQGVRAQDTFNVYQENKRVASLEVIQVRKDISAADIKQITSGAQIKVGDVVK